MTGVVRPARVVLGGGGVLRGRAPLRVSFAGGGTDIPPFPDTDGGVVLSAAINRFARGSLSPRRRDAVAPVHDDPAFPGLPELVKAATRRMGRDPGGGYDLVLRCDAPPGSGLGSSSALVVVLVGLLRDHLDVALDRDGSAHLAYLVERHDLGLHGGLQDHYAAAFGGINLIEFGDRVVVNPLPVRDGVRRELEANLLLCFTGVTRDSSKITAEQINRLAGRRNGVLAALRAQKAIAMDMTSALLAGDLDAFGHLLGAAWLQKRRISPLISTPRIDQAYDLAIRNGALGGKVTGAGGGGHLMFYCGEGTKPRVADALTRFGATVVAFGFARDGLTTWRA